MPFINFNHEWIDESQPVLTVEDRSFRFGDGIFDTILVVDGKLYDLPSHLTRLRNGLEHFRIAYDSSNLEQLCHDIVKKNNLQSGYVRIIVSRGLNTEKALGYKPGNPKPYAIVQTIESAYPAFSTIRLWQSSYQLFYHIPCKINSSMHYALALQEAVDNNCENALLTDANGNLCETASANIFWIKGNTLYTPSLELPMVPGTIRNTVLSLWEGNVEEGTYTIEDLKTSDEIFMSNIGGLITKVASIEPVGVKSKTHTKTEALRSKLDQHIKESARFGN